MKDNKDYIELFHEYGIYFPTKTINVNGEVGEYMYDMLVTNLHILDTSSGEITIKLFSGGGCVTTARGIYDLIRGCKNIVRVIVYGEAASAATLILQAADLRIMSPNSKLMIHVGSEGVPVDHPRNVDSLIEQYRVDEKWIEDIYLEKIKEKKPRYSREKLKRLLTFDKSLNVKEALDLGLIDKVGEIQ